MAPSPSSMRERASCNPPMASSTFTGRRCHRAHRPSRRVLRRSKPNCRRWALNRHWLPTGRLPGGASADPDRLRSERNRPQFQVASQAHATSVALLASASRGKYLDLGYQPLRALSHGQHRQDCATFNVSFAAANPRAAMSLMGRQRPFAASGSSRWLGLVAESLTCLCVPPPNVKFRGTADSRPRTGAINVRYRRPPTFAGRIRTAAPSLKLESNLAGRRSALQREEPVAAGGRTRGKRHQADVRFGGRRWSEPAIRGTAAPDGDCADGIAPRPPHRSVRAALPHTAPALSHDAKR